VVGLREKMNWFERLPLFGRSIVVTRARGQSAEFNASLRQLGASVLEFPTIEIRPALDYGPLDRAIEALDQYDWLIFTSANGVERFIARLDASERDLRALRARLCAIGPATRRALTNLHLKVDRMPEEYVAESLVEAFAGEPLAGKRILLPRAAVARDTAPDGLRARGALVDVVEAYRSEIPEGAALRASELFHGAHRPDWITFTSSSTVKNCVAAAGLEALQGIRIASIGPVTSAVCRQYGLDVTVEASPYTTAGLLEAILNQSRDPEGALGTAPSRSRL
jgi:uroporphyrinogen III methyltransferase/synthase